ncbi:Serine/threonine-protein kinase PrkC [Gemmata sp. SH-PL17]|uniref:protein kinase domain-containing protein n=1 Tax=Gemmata sp. SH-PL17 TaxID=1630693 RepID=UPI00078B9706|nr:protein kinase [Gemmata sp. SH-PL17]AMV25775.1 Serine/threonine-protein kinase PrkC [Gemmata sp. SH-PL17]
MSDTGDRPPTDTVPEPAPLDIPQAEVRTRFAPGDPLPNLEMWVLERWLGGGGFGEVWLARHERKGVAAVKFCTDPTARHQLVTHERTVVARVMKHGDHPNIVPLLECNLSGDIPWLMYEFVEGGTLAEAVEEWSKLPAPRRLGRTVRVLHTIASAMAKFHQLTPPLVHRDLKPQNVLMSQGVPRITDFGIGGVAAEAAQSDRPEANTSILARVPTLLRAMGSSRYAPQEQLFGSPPNPRDDVFAIGVLAYQMMLSDLTAIPGPDAAAELRALKIPVELAALIVRSVAFDPERRPKDATEWEAKLTALLQKKTVSRSPAPNPGESRDDPTEELEVPNASDSSGSIVTQMLDVPARGRWYSRPAGKSGVEWRIVATTPAEVRLATGELYRFSIKSTATEKDVAALAVLGGLRSLYYLNLSYCAGVTDAGLTQLKNFTHLRQLFLRACPNITDAGLVNVYGLTHLRTLELTDCPKLTSAAIDAVQKALPKCKIQR